MTNRDLNSGEQQDTVELLGYLLDHCPSGMFFFDTLFEYRFQINGRASACPSCHQVPQPVPSSSKVLQISVPSGATSASLADLLKRHFAVQSQSEGRMCAVCSVGDPNSPKWPFLEKLNITKYPPYLFVQILRMDFVAGKIVKNTTPVEISDMVSIGIVKYRAVGITTHIGTAEAGHNRAFLKKGSNWFLCEDEKMPYPKEPADSIHEQSYCILLEKIPSTEILAQPQPQPPIRSWANVVNKPPTTSSRIAMQPCPPLSAKTSSRQSTQASLGLPTKTCHVVIEKLPENLGQRSVSSDNLAANFTKPNLKRSFSSNDSLDQSGKIKQQPGNKEICKGCRKPFTRLLYHLSMNQL